VPPTGAVNLAVRPEKLEIAKPGGAPENRLTGTVRDIVYQGDTLSIFVALDDGTGVALTHMASKRILSVLPRTGEPIELSLHPADVAIVSVG